jgi:peptidoglycan/LPS O-acetylase OafA/YrhL
VKKIEYFEGLRGLAALVVVNEHLLKLLFALTFSDAALRSAGFSVFEEATFPPFNLLHNGAWAVCMFFVLSGYVLSNSFFSTPQDNNRGFVANVAARYVRLAIPVTFSLILVWALMHCGVFYFSEVALVTQSHEINQYTTQPTLWQIFEQGFGSAIFKDDLHYNPVLWTMSVEMYGSIGVFFLQAIFLSFLNNRNAFLIRLCVYVGLIALFFPTLYTGFILGMLLCDVRNNPRANGFLEKHSEVWVPAALIIGILLCAYMIRGLYTNPFRFITFKEFHPYYEYIYNTWGAFLVVAAITYSKKISSTLSKPIFNALGKISFPLYLTHYTIMSSLTAYLYLNLPVDGHVMKATIAVGISIPAMFLVAYLFHLIVNNPTIILSRKIKALLGKQPKTEVDVAESKELTEQIRT